MTPSVREEGSGASVLLSEQGETRAIERSASEWGEREYVAQHIILSRYEVLNCQSQLLLLQMLIAVLPHNVADYQLQVTPYRLRAMDLPSGSHWPAIFTKMSEMSMLNPLSINRTKTVAELKGSFNIYHVLKVWTSCHLGKLSDPFLRNFCTT